MRPLDLLKRAAGKSPGYLLKRAALEARRALGAGRLRRRLVEETPDDVARRAGATTLRELWERGSARTLTLGGAQRESLRALYETRLAQEAGRLRGNVERILRHEFDLLGSGPVCLGASIDWHLDFKSGHRFPSEVPSQAIDYAQLNQPSDVKVPWELSRGQHLTRLGQAWVLTRDPHAPREFEEEIRSWIAANPPGTGVNWACTMDVALRAVSWVWAFALFDGAPFTAGFSETLLHALYQHGVWIPGHLEVGEVNGNHFLSDALGMIALGCAFDATEEGRRWKDQGARLFEEEILGQSTPDGAGIEGSVPYHRLVLELFLVGRRFLAAAGRPTSPAFDARLERMLEFVEAYVTPEGLSPVVGDADDGRALVLGSDDVRDHGALLSTGAVLFKRASFRGRAGTLREDTVWLLGPDAAAVFDGLAAEAPSSGTRGFPDGGFFVLRGDSQYLFVDAGPVGFKGRGGHGHNDCLAFEWHALGRPVLTDSGAYVYTASPEWRNRFRSTAFHNTIRVDGEEINRFPSSLALWSLRNDAVPSGVALSAASAGPVLVASHSGYRRLDDPVTVTRRFSVETGARLRLEDRLEGRAEHLVEFFFHAAPEGCGRPVDGSLELEWAHAVRVRVSPRGGPPVAWELREGWFSPSYGVKLARETWVASARAVLPFTVEWLLEAVPA